MKNIVHRAWFLVVGSFSRSRNTAGTRSIVSETPPTNLQRSELAYPWETLLDSWICFIEWSWPYDGLYLMLIACIWPKILSKVRLYGGRLADAHRRTQTHADERRCTQTNARQTASSVWADAISRCVQTLDVCSRTFRMYYISGIIGDFPGNNQL